MLTAVAAALQHVRRDGIGTVSGGASNLVLSAWTTGAAHAEISRTSSRRHNRRHVGMLALCRHHVQNSAPPVSQNQTFARITSIGMSKCRSGITASNTNFVVAIETG